LLLHGLFEFLNDSLQLLLEQYLDCKLDEKLETELHGQELLKELLGLLSLLEIQLLLNWLLQLNEIQLKLELLLLLEQHRLGHEDDEELLEELMDMQLLEGKLDE
jgi:hypothetical protein